MRVLCYQGIVPKEKKEKANPFHVRRFHQMYYLHTLYNHHFYKALKLQTWILVLLTPSIIKKLKQLQLNLNNEFIFKSLP